MYILQRLLLALAASPVHGELLSRSHFTGYSTLLSVTNDVSRRWFDRLAPIVKNRQTKDGRSIFPYEVISYTVLYARFTRA